MCLGSPPPVAAEELPPFQLSSLLPPLPECRQYFDQFQQNQFGMTMQPNFSPTLAAVQIPENNFEFHNNAPAAIAAAATAGPPINFWQPYPPQPNLRQTSKPQKQDIVVEKSLEELMAESWAWRKVGQKSIKGSPHQRIYFRCIAYRGCAAKRKVEQHATKADKFVVTYYGEHTHLIPRLGL
ncbi:WRKY transcription factor WRKY62-like [Andrographis paniculata]|uniref:WRKY transcription factor WRKY62-like n=1 Tax=Andrographis paniculata TaxID=175694 RepID=UPI0021E8A5D2|nr:WRKY transcription factor WRKY62-like [Andrographis paniculata]